jgi:hypothetical protein
VLDRDMDFVSLPLEIAKITSGPIEIVFDAVSSAETQKIAYSLLAPDGILMLVLPFSLGDEHKDEKKVICVNGSPFAPANKEVSTGLYANLTSYLEQGLIKVYIFVL